MKQALVHADAYVDFPPNLSEYSVVRKLSI